MFNAKPRLSPWSRLLLVERVLAGRPAAHVAAEMGVSRATAYKWLARYRARGHRRAGRSLQPSPSQPGPDRSGGRGADRGAASRPPARAGADRRDPAAGSLDGAPGADPARHAAAGLAGPAHRAGDPPLRTRPARRAGPRRRQEDRPAPRRRRLAGARPRQPEHRRSPNGGHGSATTTSTPPSTTTPAWPTPRSTPTRRPRPAPGSCAAPPPGSPTTASTIERVMTDNALAYRRSRAWRQALGRPRRRARFTRRYRPQTNGKAERFNRTLLEEWAYAEPFDHQRRAQPPPCHVAAHLQPSPRPHRARRPPTHQPRQQPPGALQLEASDVRGRRTRCRSTRTWR